MAGDTASLPLEISDEPLVGWRCWYVLPHEGLLRPIYKRGLAWKPRQAHEAVCPEQPHEVPADGCKCGIWTVCHPMLLDEIGWTVAPPAGIPKLAGVLVVGQVALWGKIVEHERGWRASAAYPRHLYALTDDPMVAETLRERYGIPVEWGEEANRLRRLLPPAATDEEEQQEAAPALREVLLDVLRHGLAPQVLVKLAGRALDDWQDLVRPPAERREAARRALVGGPAERRQARYGAYLAHADARALDGDSLAARRALWVRVALWQRSRAKELWKKMQPWITARDALLEDLARGVSAGPVNKGRPYATQTLYGKRKESERLEAEILALVPRVEALAAVTIPTYREWRAVARGIIARPAVPTPSAEEQRLWHQHAMRREARLAEQERRLSLARQTMAAERATTQQALDEARAALEAERAALREDVIAGVARDRAALLEEVGELERRRRGALALLPGAWPPTSRPDPMSRSFGVAAAHPALASRLRELGIIQARVAELAGVSRASVSNVLSGRSRVRPGAPKCQQVLQAARALIADAEARAKDTAPPPPADAVPAAEAAPAPSPRDELARERAELDELTRVAAAERAKVTLERRDLEQARRRADLEHKERVRAAAAEESSRVAGWLAPRLKAVGITQTRIAKAAGVGISAVCRVLSGQGTSVRVVAVANRLLAQAESRARARKTARRKRA